TEHGREKAISVMRKHRLAERLLADVIGLEWELVHDEACRWEHVMSEDVERRLVKLLDFPTESPYGNPIPGLEQLGLDPAPVFSEGVENLVQVVRRKQDAVRGIVRRLGEPLQVEPDLLVQLKEAGVLP